MELFKLFGSIGLKDDATKPLEEIGKKGKNISEGLGANFSKLGKVVAGAFTVKAIVDFEKKIVGVYSTYDDQMRKIQAVTGATGKEYDALRAKAEELGASTRFSATEAGEGMENLARAGWKTQDVLEGINPMLTFATANSIDLGTASGIVANGLSMFGLKAKDATKFTDILSKTASASNTDINLLGETLKYSGALAGSMGYKIEELSVAMGLMANKSITGSQAGTTLKNAILRLNNPVGQGAKDMKKLGISITDSSGKVKPFSELLEHLRDKFSGLDEAQKAQYIATIFGSEAVAGMTAVLNASTEEFEGMTSAIADADGTTKKMADTMDSGLGGALASVSSAWEGLLIKLGNMQDGILVDAFNKLAEVIQGLPNEIEYLSNKIKELTDFYKEHKTIIDTLAVGLGVMAAGFITVNSKAKIAELGIVGFMNGTKLLKGVPTILGGIGKAFTFLLTPAGLVTAAIAGIAMGAFLIYKNWDSISAWFANEWEYISNLFSNGYNNFIEWCSNIGTSISSGLSALKEKVIGFFTPIGEFLGNIVKAGILAVKFALEAGMTLIINAIRLPLEFIMGLFKAVWSKVGDGVMNVVNKVKDFFSNIFLWIQVKILEQLTFQDSVWNKFKDIVINIWNTIKDAITNVVNVIKNVVTTVWNGIKNVTSTVFNAVKNVVVNIWNGIKDVIVKVVTTVKENVSNIWNGIKETTSNVFGALSNKVGEIWNNIKEKITRPVDKAKDMVKSSVDRIKGFFTNLRIPEIKIPHVKLPHFSLQGKFSLKEMTVPKLKVDWYSGGGIFTKPTVFPNGIGVGDRNNGRGSAMEAVLPIDKLRHMIRDEMEDMKQDVVLNVDGRAVARATVPFIGTEMEYRRNRRK